MPFVSQSACGFFYLIDLVTMILQQLEADLSVQKKILNMLVGYLATVAVIPPPYYPFAFASPLATVTHYDGYVNASTLMEHSNSLEARQAEFAPPVLTVIAIVALVTLSIVWVESDDPVRYNIDQVKHFD